MFRKLFSKGNLSIGLSLLMVPAMSFVLTSKGALADDRMPIKATFTVAYSGTPNTTGVSFCGGTPLDIAIEARGTGFDARPTLPLAPENFTGDRAPYAWLPRLDSSEWRYVGGRIRRKRNCSKCQ